MKFRSLGKWLVGAGAIVATVVLGGCGGGGASGNADVGGALQLLPNSGTLYAGVPYTFQVVGGRAPYVLSSSEPSVLPVPDHLDGHSFDVVAANTAVVDTGLPPGSLPVRTVTLTARSSDGQTVNTGLAIKVAQNFLLGYGVSTTPLTCPINATGTGLEACSGGTTAVNITAAINGNLQGNRQYRFTPIRGPFQFVAPPGTLVNGVDVIVPTDHSGNATAIMQVQTGVTTQLAVFRVIDVATGVYIDHTFVITGVATNGALTILPNTLTFTGNFTTQCGTGTGDVLVFNGVPPFQAFSSNAGSISASVVSGGSQPGIVEINMPNQNPPCQTGTVVITDSLGNRGSVTVTSVLGTATPPPLPLTVSPGSITLACGASGSVTVIGGGTGATATYSVSTVSSNILASVSGNTLTITRANIGTAPVPATVNVTDGARIVPVSVTSPATCP